MSLEVVRDERGYIASGVNNPAGTNQWSPERRSQRRIALAIDRRLALPTRKGETHCIEKYVDAVVEALESPTKDKALDLLKYALPAASKLDVGLSGPSGGPIEIAGPERLEAISASFVSRFTPNPDVGEEDPDGSGTGGAS